MKGQLVMMEQVHPFPTFPTTFPAINIDGATFGSHFHILMNLA